MGFQGYVGLNGANLIFQVPVAAKVRGTCRIGRSGHIRAGQVGNSLEQIGTARLLCQVAAIEENVTVRR